MTDTTAPAPDAADLRGRPGAGAVLAEQIGEAGARREKRRDIRPLARLLPYALRHKGHVAMAAVWLLDEFGSTVPISIAVATISAIAFVTLAVTKLAVHHTDKDMSGVS